LEIKIAQGAKPGEGGQLPAKKVTVEIAAARGGTPGIELVSPPPHHDTYSIEDLAQLIHDCKAARVRVIVKLVSSEGIGTIAVGVAKAGADIINVAGNTGGTGAAAVTSLKNTGRSAEIGIAEVHQALAANGLREKVILRASAAHQTGLDVVKSAILGADSYEFGTTALMMIGCVMAKNCNIACPAGLTTNPEVFTGDGRKLAQFYLNVAHEVREILAWMGFPSLRSIRGKTDLLQLVNHDSIVGRLDMRAMLKEEQVWMPDEPVYLEANFRIDEIIWAAFNEQVVDGSSATLDLRGPEFRLDNNDKTVGGRSAVDIERWLNYESSASHPAVRVGAHDRRYLAANTVTVHTHGSAGQSYGAFCNDGLRMQHSGTANDGVGKSMNGGTVVVRNPGGGSDQAGANVLIGNFALFGATGGQMFIAGEAGDRCAVRNSGALAVIEGAGDFCCEYMTNGTVLNLGGAGKGFGNGMSGGIAYQYDPDGELSACYNEASVVVCVLSASDELLAPHAEVIQHLLQAHVAATDSPLAASILADWSSQRGHFRVVIPRALFDQHSAESLQQRLSRKELTDELATSMAGLQIAALKASWDAKEPIEGGAIPAYGETDTSLMFRLLNRYAVLNKALMVAEKKLRRGDFQVEQAHVDRYAKHLVRGLDHQLIEALSEDARQALGHFSEEELAILLADKRIRNYKTALAKRDVCDTQALGMTAWILYHDRRNRSVMADIPEFDELLATYLMGHLAEDLARAGTPLQK
jgi:glutamate synthase (NADPH/NADH) large chain